MKILKSGVDEEAALGAWSARVTCRGELPTDLRKSELNKNGCKAILEATAVDLHVRKWVDDCGYKGMKYYHAYVQCPNCNTLIFLDKTQIHPLLLHRWAKEFGFSGYVVPSGPVYREGWR